MIVLFLAIPYLLINAYLLRCFLHWLDACHPCFSRRHVRGIVAALSLFLALSPAIGFLLPTDGFGRGVRLLGNYWLGLLLYLVLLVPLSQLIGWLLLRRERTARLVTRRSLVLCGAVCIAVLLAVGVGGVVQAHTVRTTTYDVTVAKDGGTLDGLDVVLVSDLHMGYDFGQRSLAATVDAINEQEPDLVVLAGDIFDNAYDALDDPAALAAELRRIDSTYGVYACYGNHDIDEPILAGITFGGGDGKHSDPRMDAWLADAGVVLLQDETVSLADGSLSLTGRRDARKPGGDGTRLSAEELLGGLDHTRPLLVLDHEPSELHELADAGADLILSGHTHDGQMFPATLLMPLLWENPCGWLRVGGAQSIVTSGVGVFGPNMRVGTRAEICAIHVAFS